LRRTYKAIREMIRQSLLETHTARDIVRKSMISPAESSSGVDNVLNGVDLFQQYAFIDRSGANHSQYGAVLSYNTTFGPQTFPESSSPQMLRFWDFKDINHLKLLVTVTKVAGANVTLELRLQQDIGNPGPSSISFSGGNPSVPLDSLGLHITDWHEIQFLPESLEGRPAQCRPFFVAPSASVGTTGIGLIQILAKKD
jgi:hypothetical protein